MTCPRDFIVLISFMVVLTVHTSYGSEIIEGNEVTPHSMPYMVLVMNATSICGGTLISPSWVLTAAHCGKIGTVYLGVHSIKKISSTSTQELKVTKHFRHPNYKEPGHDDDLMLLKLDKNVKESQTVKWLNVGATVQDPKAGSHCLVAGWGTTKYRSKIRSDVLMAVNVTVISRKECNSPDFYNRKPVITNDMICAGSNGENKADSCQGDSGGPLLCKGNIVGVTSFGRGCGIIKKPGVYAFLSKKQLKWIKTTMKKNEI